MANYGSSRLSILGALAQCRGTDAGADLVLGEDDTTVAASTGRVVSITSSRAYLLRGISLDPRVDATGLRGTGIGTDILVNSKPITWSSDSAGATQSWPLGIMTPEALGPIASGARDLQALLPSAQAVALRATLDLAGNCAMAVAVDYVPPDQAAAQIQAAALGQLPWDSRIIFGLGTGTAADAADITLSGKAQVACDEMGWLWLEISGIVANANPTKLKIKSIKIGNTELLSDQTLAAAHTPLTMFSPTSPLLVGLWVGHAIDASQSATVVITNNTGGNATVRGCFLRTPAAGAASAQRAKQAPTATAPTQPAQPQPRGRTRFGGLG